jgi:hypothetical protein
MVDYVVNPTASLSVRLTLRRRGMGVKEVDLDAVRQPELCRAVVDMLLAPDGDRELELDSTVIERLSELGVLVPDSDVPGTVAYSCPLSLEGLELIPYASRHEHPGPPLVVSSGLCIQDGPDVPGPLRDRVAPCSTLSPARPILWVADPDTQIWMPTWPDHEISRTILDLQSGTLAMESLGDAARRVLRLAGVLLPSSAAGGQPISRAEELERAACDLRDRGHAVLRKLLPPLQQAAIRRYVRSLQREGIFHEGDDHVPTRTRVHNEAVTSLLHRGFSGIVNRIVPSPCKPSYSLLVHYRPGSDLGRHTDREQCEWNVSWIADADPETEEESAWPIHFEHKGEEGMARLEIGDAVLYSGRRTPHWRDALSDGRHVDACFFHFVDARFEGSLD